MTMKHLVHLYAGCLMGCKRTSTNPDAWEWIARWMCGYEDPL